MVKPVTDGTNPLPLEGVMKKVKSIMNEARQQGAVSGAKEFNKESTQLNQMISRGEIHNPTSEQFENLDAY